MGQSPPLVAGGLCPFKLSHQGARSLDRAITMLHDSNGESPFWRSVTNPKPTVTASSTARAGRWGGEQRKVNHQSATEVNSIRPDE